MGCAASIREALNKNKLTVDRNHFYFAKVIGCGGFGTVFSAMHVDYQSWFAVSAKYINSCHLFILPMYLYFNSDQADQQGGPDEA